jgi:hypothetical protein
MTTIEIIERSRPALRQLQIDLKGRAVNIVMGSAVVTLLRRHFLALPPNKRGFPTTHFWRRAADATKFEATHDSVRISVNQTGVRQRFLGGDINPVRAKFLTIPAIAETYGHRAGDFSGLKVVQGWFAVYTGRNATLALVPKDWKQLGFPGDSTGVYFWLVKNVSQKPDPTVLPTDDEIGKTAVRVALRFFRRMHIAR